MVERRKNWLQRQINRMGSVRSSSTTYSSNGGFFTRNRHNSVYSSPENGVLPQIHSNSNNKPSFYDRMVGRKSMRSQRMSRQGIIVIYCNFNQDCKEYIDECKILARFKDQLICFKKKLDS